MRFKFIWSSFLGFNHTSCVFLQLAFFSKKFQKLIFSRTQTKKIYIHQNDPQNILYKMICNLNFFVPSVFCDSRFSVAHFAFFCQNLRFSKTRTPIKTCVKKRKTQLLTQNAGSVVEAIHTTRNALSTSVVIFRNIENFEKKLYFFFISRVPLGADAQLSMRGDV